MVYLIVGLFGAVGALLRYSLGVSINMVWHQAFPLATLTANLVGSFFLGLLTMHLSRLKIFHPYLLTGLGTGLIGAFTTFSTFSVETVKLFQASHWVTAIFYVLISLWGGLFCSWMGFKLGDYLFKKKHAVNL